jgi:hypothetical protein
MQGSHPEVLGGTFVGLIPGLGAANSQPAAVPMVNPAYGSPTIAHELAESRGNPFSAMDSGDKPAPVLSRSSVAGELEVGYHDPVLGYVELRAHGGNAGIHASLGAESQAAGQTLETHLSSLTSWMNNRHTPLESLTVLTPGPNRNSESSWMSDARSSHPGSGGGSNSRDEDARQNASSEGPGDRSVDRLSKSSVTSEKPSSNFEKGDWESLTQVAGGLSSSLDLTQASRASISVMA